MFAMKIGCEKGDIKVIRVSDRDYDTGHDATLYEIHEIVGGWPEPCAPLELKRRNIQLFSDEEGLLKQYDLNENLFPFFYVGPLVAVGFFEGEFCSLTRYQIDFLKDWLKNLG